MRAVLLCLLATVAASPTHRGSEECGYKGCPILDKNVLNVHIVPHTHDDVGWLKTVDQYYYGSRNNIQKAGVQYILDSVIKELWQDPKRRFIYVETAFFWKWWTRQTEDVKRKVHQLVDEGRLQFVGGAWSMNDEAAAHYQSTVDQFTWGLSKLNQTFGYCALPKVGWQIDPFGHSREFANLLAGMGYDGLFLGRLDYQDKANRLRNKHMEMIWRGNDDIGEPSDIFTGVLFNTYSPPSGFCFDVLCDDEPIIDDPDSPLFNVDKRVSDFIAICNNSSRGYISNNILITMGEDFMYQDASMWYTNLDKLIQYTNLKAAKDGLNINLVYSTPNCYLKAVKDADPKLPTKTDDFFPYASDPTAFWTGYFTSRPTTKYFERSANGYLQMLKQLQALTGLQEHNQFVLNELKSAMGVMQHHDAITGTEKQHVTRDYERILTQAVDDAWIIANQALNKAMHGESGDMPSLSFDRCHFNESRCDTSEENERFIVTAYNPLSWTLPATPISVPVQDGNYVVVAPNGEEIISQLIDLPDAVTQIPTRQSKATHELVFLAYNVPGLGYKSFYVEKKKEEDRVKRDISKKDAAVFDSINNYWKDIKESFKPEDIVNVESQETFKNNKLYTEFDNNLQSNEKPLEVESRRQNKRLNVEKEKEIDLDILKDVKEVNNKYIDDLQKMIKEVPRSFNVDVTEEKEERVQYPSLNEEEMRMLGDDPEVVDSSVEDFLETENFKLRINNNINAITHVIFPDETEFNLSFLASYYPGCFGNNENYANRSSGAYIFRPNSTESINLPLTNPKVIKGPVFNEYRRNGDYISSSVRIYQHKELKYIEHNWVVGPIPIEDDIGKEIVFKYKTDIINNGEFYTDSNGRQFLKRKLNYRPQFNLTLEEPIAGNYYPVNNEIFIQNVDWKLSVLTDRSVGGSSLEEGSVEVMVHRRLLHDDAFGVGEALNETANGKGLVVSGKHRISVYTGTFKGDAKKGLENQLQPIIFVSNADKISLIDWLTMKKKVSWIKNSLPEGIHLLTVEPWIVESDKGILVRFENYLDKTASNSVVEVDISNVFNFDVKKVKEVSLSANEISRKWKWNSDFDDDEQNDDTDNDGENNDDGFKVKIKAKQIRTFIVY